VTIDPMRSVDLSIQFALDSAELDSRARQILAALGNLLQRDLLPYSYLIAGHTDITGTFDHNMHLSFRRATSVRRHLIEVYGLDPRRLFVRGFGPTALRDRMRPASPINRRVEVVLVTATN
jgi:outer membrane protein OmpA-like peptidoglycan-associated protein